MELSGKIVIITGASMGIGAATARAFAQAGAKVVLAARSADLVAALAREIGAERALAVPTDVTVRAQVDSLMQRTVEKCEQIDILINNAGVGMAGTIATLNPAHFEKIFVTNVLGPLYAMQAVVPYLRQNGGGVILNVSSMVSKLPIPMIGSYRATKSALNTLSQNARMELARDNIRVIIVYPNITASNFYMNTLDARNAGQVSFDQHRRAQSCEFVAQKIVAGARREPREVFMGGGSRVFAFVTSLFPARFEKMMGGARPTESVQRAE